MRGWYAVKSINKLNQSCNDYKNQLCQFISLKKSYISCINISNVKEFLDGENIKF